MVAFGGWLPWKTSGLPSPSCSPLPQLEAQLNRLSSTHREASSENQQLREAERDLAGRLEEVQGQLRVTRGHLSATRGHAYWQLEEEPRQGTATPGLRWGPGLPKREEGGFEFSEALVWTQNTPRVSLLKPHYNPARLTCSGPLLRQGN